VTPETGEHLDKARECLARAKIILGAGVGEDAGRDAYLASFHAAQALILARSGKIVKTHRGVHRVFSQLAKNEPELREFAASCPRLTIRRTLPITSYGRVRPCRSTARAPRSIPPSGSSGTLPEF
jgi:uncharacterized protein (UPF0332 family)